MALDTEAEKALLSSGNANKDLVADRGTKNKANFFDLFFFDISKKTRRIFWQVRYRLLIFLQTLSEFKGLN